ncbi:MAG: hypothetical protein A3F42_00065 [Gammaproteobacteria bacterium RIFCSPHIGHO2_12_FULL_37_34]|nr:MAG: hypothetical protein A3F42_00065 [Gammaproteobacteria bacterium RIFCSPHIGHO2_12_FULL_37_34]
MTTVNLKKATIEFVSHLKCLPPNKEEIITTFKKNKFPSNEEGILKACLAIFELFLENPEMRIPPNKTRVDMFANTIKPLLKDLTPITKRPKQR